MAKCAVVFGSALLLTLVLGCDDPVGPGKPDPITQLPRDLTAAEEVVLARSNVFGMGLLREVDQHRTEDKPNTVISPLSASMALGMALEGADGETFAEMQDVLGFQGMTREEINVSYSGIMDLLLTLDPEVELGIANSAWIREGFPFTDQYFDAITQSFSARVEELDFSDPGAKDMINQWVDDQTHGRIEEIIDGISPLDILFLINAVYFKGDWTTQFKKAETQPAPFYKDDGSTTEVPMMSGLIPDVGAAWVGGGRQVVELPYGGQAFGMVVVLPGPSETATDVLAGLDAALWQSWMDALHLEEVQVRMPRLELEWDGLLKEPLKAMGMIQAFDPGLSDFSRMTTAPDAYISSVRQKTYMRVDEEGTEAAAATSVGIGTVSAPPSVTVNRPYLLAIRERLSGSVLFLGVIRDPSL